MRRPKMWELTWPEIKELIDEDYGVILPIGAIEQHGHHLPTMTDTYLPVEVTASFAEDVRMMVAFPIAYATNSRPLSGGGQTFIATTSLRAETFMHQVEDVLREFIRHGFKKIVIFNWHCENSNFVYEAAFRATDNGMNHNVKIMVMEAPFGRLSDEVMHQVYGDDFPGWPLEHAGVLETSLMMYLNPEMVLEDKIIDDGPKEVQWYDVVPVPDKFVAKSGCLWEATRSTREKGEIIWNELRSQLIETINNEFKE